MPVKVEMHADIACPWCFIGLQRLQRAMDVFAGAAEVELVHVPFQLDPDESAGASSLRESLVRKYGPEQSQAMIDQMSELGRAEGIDFRIDLAQAVNTLMSHRLLWLAARTHGVAVQTDLKRRLFEAYFCTGGNIGDTGLLVELAEQVGMDGERVASFLSSDEGLAEMLVQVRGARAAGISAVPTFVVGGSRRVEGAQEARALLRMLEESASGAGVMGQPQGSQDGVCAI